MLISKKKKKENSFDFRSEEWYRRCREWLVSAGGRRLWEKDMVWGKNESDLKVCFIWKICK